MYQQAKSILSKIISPRHLIKHEDFFRSIYAVFFTGSKHSCPICKKGLSKFITLYNNDLLCPRCGSLARDRRLWTLLNEEFLTSGMKVLDFSPSRSIARRMKKIRDIDYISTDLSGNFIAEFQYDITNLDIKDNTIDLIVCYHILEHIIDDKKAMQELYRVLTKGGKALIQTPFKEGNIYEDFSITSPQEREVHFGQDDHVRIYSVTGLKQRLEDSGFVVDVRALEADNYFGFKCETVLILTK